MSYAVSGTTINLTRGDTFMALISITDSENNPYIPVEGEMCIRDRELANTLPNTGGLVSWFTGDNDIAAFGTSLVSFCTNFAKYSDYMKTVDSGIVVATANAANSIVELQKSLPKEGGWFSDDMTLASFGSDMASFGSHRCV